MTTLKPDLVFLDIQMPGLDGMDVTRWFESERRPAIVFVTAHEEFAVQAFEAQALDYLVKPLSEARFRSTITRVLAQLSTRPSRRILVPTSSGGILLDAGEIDWIEAQDDHAVIHAGAKRYKVRQSLAELEARLDSARFARIHRSVIVHLDHVRELHIDPRRGAVIRLRDGTDLPVSRRRLAQIKTRLRATSRSPRRSRRSPRQL
jgi:two-component system LytT family response regulator